MDWFRSSFVCVCVCMCVCVCVCVCVYSSRKEFEADMKQKQEHLQPLREKLLRLIEAHPDSPEAATWRQMLAQIGALNPHKGFVLL